MHEASIALGVIAIAEEYCAREAAPGAMIQAVRVRVGAASGVLPEALLTAFDIVKLDYPRSIRAKLIVEEVPLGGVCARCGREFETLDQFLIECPVCGASGGLSFARGRELDVLDLEVDE